MVNTNINVFEILLVEENINGDTNPILSYMMCHFLMVKNVRVYVNGMKEYSSSTAPTEGEIFESVVGLVGLAPHHPPPT